MLTGERDPLVDDTVIFAGRLRQAKRAEWVTGREMGMEWARGSFREEEKVSVELVPGISHGFLQFVGVFPEGWRHIFRCAGWIEEAFSLPVGESAVTSAAQTPWQSASGRERGDYFSFGSGATPGLAEAVDGLREGRGRRHHYRSATQSDVEEDRPLEMTVVGKKRGLTPPLENGAREGASQRSRGRARRGEQREQRGRRKSLVSLASEDDLLGRRMRGLTGGLGGESGVV